jgi:hypothetical protein
MRHFSTIEHKSLSALSMNTLREMHNRLVSNRDSGEIVKISAALQDGTLQWRSGMNSKYGISYHLTFLAMEELFLYKKPNEYVDQTWLGAAAFSAFSSLGAT